jgi:hypothetical protein
VGSGDDSSAQPGASRTLTNFGGNQTWQARCYRPRNGADVLEILNRHSQEHVRPWEQDIRERRGGQPGRGLGHERFRPRAAVRGRRFVDVGAGCRLQNLLDRLHATTDQTLPTVGAIKRQTMSGAISTGTHGSGKPSLSHFVASVRSPPTMPQPARQRYLPPKLLDDIWAFCDPFLKVCADLEGLLTDGRGRAGDMRLRRGNDRWISAEDL